MGAGGLEQLVVGWSGRSELLLFAARRPRRRVAPIRLGRQQRQERPSLLGIATAKPIVVLARQQDHNAALFVGRSVRPRDVGGREAVDHGAVGLGLGFPQPGHGARRAAGQLDTPALRFVLQHLAHPLVAVWLIEIRKWWVSRLIDDIRQHDGKTTGVPGILKAGRRADLTGARRATVR